MLEVETTFVLYLNAKAQLEAAAANVAQAQTALDASAGKRPCVSPSFSSAAAS